MENGKSPGTDKSAPSRPSERHLAVPKFSIIIRRGFRFFNSFPKFAVHFKNHRVMADLIKIVEQEFAKTREIHPGFKPGDTINVHVKIKEGNKERIQQFQGTVIQRKNKGSNGET